jgi:hypothetical protein
MENGGIFMENEFPKDITYCSNENCSRKCERNIVIHDFKDKFYSIADLHNENNLDGKNCEYYIEDSTSSENSYAVWKDFEFRTPTYLDGRVNKNKYDLVKWRYHKPYEVLDLTTGQKIISTRSCFSIGELIWDNKEPGFDFHSCGLRYLKERIDGLEEFIISFAEKEHAKRVKNKI